MKKLANTLFCLLFLLSTSYGQMAAVANNLNGPSGIESDAEGNIWVTETGSGANDGQVLRIRTSGQVDTIIKDLPSFFDPAVEELTGAWRTISMANHRLAVLMGGGPTPSYGRILMFNLTGFQPGISKAKTIVDTTSSIDISTFALAQTGVMGSNPFSAVLDSDGSWYVADAAANMVIKVSSTGVRSVFARFPPVANPTPVGPPMVDAVPTKIIANPDGGFYVSTLTGFPFNAGKASIYNLSKNGDLSVYAKGFTMLTDMTLDYRTGDIYALQFGEFAFAPSPGFVFGSGKVYRVPRGGANSEVVVSNFGPGSGIAQNPDGDFYITSLFTSQLLKMDKAVCSDVGLTLTASQNNLSLYTSMKFTLTATNNGAENASNVRVYWLPPYKRFEGDSKPFAYQASYASKGYLDGWHGYWTIPNLAVGETATATFHLFVIDDSMDALQTAEVADCNLPFPIFGGAARPSQIELRTPANRQYSLNYTSPIRVGPNPAFEQINVQVNNETDKEWTIKLYNTLGQVVSSINGQNSQTVVLDILHVQNGLYLVEYQSAGARKIEKVLIQH